MGVPLQMGNPEQMDNSNQMGTSNQIASPFPSPAPHDVRSSSQSEAAPQISAPQVVAQSIVLSAQEYQRDFYGDLGLLPTATPEEIAARYAELCNAVQPMRAMRIIIAQVEAFRRFRGIERAHRILTDPYTKAAYDTGVAHGLVRYFENRATQYQVGPWNSVEHIIGDYMAIIRQCLGNHAVEGITLQQLQIILTENGFEGTI